MSICRRFFSIFTGLLLALTGVSAAQEDPGKENIGRISVGVIYATNGDPSLAGRKLTPLVSKFEKQIRTEKQLVFKSYGWLGREVKPLFRSYENWAQPLKPSDEVLVRFEARKLPTPDVTPIDLELWLSRKKILKTDVTLKGEKPLLVLGPEWRGGHLIISIALAPEAKPVSK
ncbi:MAG: hypothetical protein QM680_03590 [Luteolibacter sp.]